MEKIKVLRKNKLKRWIERCYFSLIFFIGVQATIPYCVKQSDKATVADNYCEASEKPIVLTQTCYENECPKVYEYKVNFTECSVTCAKGLY